jgi:flagellar biosynthesis protein FlhB
MARDSAQERTERATPKRLREAREKGEVARSRELSTTMVLLAGSGGLLAMSEHLIDGLSGLMRDGLVYRSADIFQESAMIGALLRLSADALFVIAPVLAFLILAAFVAPLALSGWVFNGNALSLKWERLDPIRGIKRIFAWRGLVELFKALAKFGLIAVATVVILWQLSRGFLGLGAEPLIQGIGHAGRLLGWSFLMLSATMLLIAGIDVPFQLWDHARKLKMTRQEVKDELKETEGRPEVKGRIRRLQQEAAQRRMMTEVPKADVVVTNPTYYAVALRYDQSRMHAPIVVAKGVDLIAENIRRIATEHGVPILSAPPLARALHYSTKLNQTIPAGLYLAVAKVLAYVYQLRQGPLTGVPSPMPPDDAELPIPDELKRGR